MASPTTAAQYPKKLLELNRSCLLLALLQILRNPLGLEVIHRQILQRLPTLSLYRLSYLIGSRGEAAWERFRARVQAISREVLVGGLLERSRAALTCKQKYLLELLSLSYQPLSEH